MSGTRTKRSLVTVVLTSAALCLPAVGTATRAALADATASVDDRSVSAPTGWRTATGLTPSQVNSTVVAGGYRLTEVHADQPPSNPTTYTVRAVRNSGAYAVAGWWWYYGLTQAQVTSHLNANNARLVSLDGYLTSSGSRYAVVMVSNAGAAHKSWHWWVSTSAPYLAGKVSTYNDRIIDIGEYLVGTTHVYTAVTVHNVAPDAKTSHFYVGQTAAQVSALLSRSHERLVDVEATGAGTWDVVMQNDGIGFNVWYVGVLSRTQLLGIAQQTGTRLIAVQRYGPASAPRFSGVFLNNLSGASATMRTILWPSLGSFDHWGFYSKKVGGPALTALQQNYRFEPASAIKVVSHLYLHLRQQNSNMDYGTSIAYPYRAGDAANRDICPATGDPLATTTVGNADTKMMTVSDNRMTRAIRDKYGYSNIAAVANIVGMGSTSFPHTLGCLTYGAYNLTTLTDLGRLYESVAAGTSIGGAARTHFYSTMLNFSNYSPARTAFCNVATTEGQSLGKSAGTIASFCDAMRWAAKGGGYTLNRSDGRHIWRSNAGRLALPVRSPAVSGAITLSEYVYGDYVHDVIATSAQESVINTARAKAGAEQFRAQIRAAIATW